jgi:polyisoprenoid-binding protein YceI
VSSCTVFTFKEGVLSAIAHDLKLRVETLDVKVEGESRVTATFDARSLRVVCAQKNGTDDPGALSAGDKHKIEETLAKDVLESRRFPEIRFISTAVEPDPRGEGHLVRGDLTLHGVTREISFTARTLGGVRVAEVTLHQPDFGITPYRAMLGALKLRPDVRVRVEVP